MLFALRHPAVLLGLVVGFLVGIVLRAIAQRAAAGERVRRRGLRPVGATRRPRAPWTSYLDPYGAVAAVIAGVGWGVRPPATRARQAWRAFVPVVVAVVVHGLLAAAGFAAYVALGGPEVLGFGVLESDLVHGAYGLGSVAAQIAVGFGAVNLGCGLLSLVPIPPLELGIALWSRLPRSPGARRLAYRLLEEAWGVVAILVGLLIPLAGQRPALLALIDIVADPLLRLV